MMIALAVVSALLAVSEALSLNDKVKANGIFQFCFNALTSIKEFLQKK